MILPQAASLQEGCHPLNLLGKVELSTRSRRRVQCGRRERWSTYLRSRLRRRASPCLAEGLWSLNK